MQDCVQVTPFLSSTSTADSANDPLTLSSRTSPRTITRRKALPNNRAIAGGLLIALAAVGTFAAASGLTSTPTAKYVVASHDLAPGTRITSADLTTVELEQSPALSAHSITKPDILIGTTLLGPLKAGELFQVGSLVNTPAGANGVALPEVSFSLPSSRSLGGVIRPGESVDILVSDKSASTNAARTAVAGAKVVRVEKAGSSVIGSSGDVTITVSVNSRESAAAIASAVDTGQVTLVRTTGVASTSDPISVQ